jgi:hypothetical protein
MDVGTIEEKLDKLARLRKDIADEEAARDEARAKLLRPLKDKLQAIDDRCQKVVGGLRKTAELVEAKVKAGVAEHGESVKGGELHAVYVKPRVSWNSEKLEGMIAFHPEIAAARTVVEQGTCQIRTIKEKGE